MSAGVVFPGDRTPWNEEVMEFDLTDQSLVLLATKSIEDGMTVEDEIVQILQKEVRRLEAQV